MTGRIAPARGRHTHVFPGHFIGSILLEPLQGRQAECIVGRVANHQPVPGTGFVEPAHLLTQVGQSLVQLGMGLQTKSLDRECLVVSSALLREILRGKVGSLARLEPSRRRIPRICLYAPL